MSCQNRKVPAIATKNGTKFIERIIEAHLNTQMHIECCKAYKQARSTRAEIFTEPPMGRCINQSNLTLANHIGSLIMHVYISAKQLTLSANTFPAGGAVGYAAAKFGFDNFDNKIFEQNFQYVTPTSFREFLEIIVQCDSLDFNKKISISLDLSLRCDGYVDRIQIDEMYSMVKAVSNTGSEELYFLGAAEPTEPGACGLLGALKEGCKITLGANADSVLKNVSSIVTDVAAVNTGCKSGLWKLFEDYLGTLSAGETAENRSFMKIWCSAHR